MREHGYTLYTVDSMIVEIAIVAFTVAALILLGRPLVKNLAPLLFAERYHVKNESRVLRMRTLLLLAVVPMAAASCSVDTEGARSAVEERFETITIPEDTPAAPSVSDTVAPPALVPLDVSAPATEETAVPATATATEETAVPATAAATEEAATLPLTAKTVTADPDCEDMDSGLTFEDDVNSATIAAPAGMLVSSYCLKGVDPADPNGSVVWYVELDAPVQSLDAVHPLGMKIKHHSFGCVPDPNVEV